MNMRVIVRVNVLYFCSSASMQRFGDLRLTGYGASTLAGRVELFDGSRWWSICNDGFDGHDANVVCSQLGLGYAVRIVNIDSDASTKFIDEYGYIQGTQDLLVCMHVCMCVCEWCMCICVWASFVCA